MLNLHEEAIKNYNSKTEAFLDFFKPYNPPKRKEYTSDHYVSAHFTPEEILFPNKFYYLTNGVGENISLIAHDNATQFIIEEIQYKKIKIVIDKISDQKEIKDFLSFKYIENILSKWLVARKLKELAVAFIPFLLSNAHQDIKSQEVWIPVPFTSATINFSFGQVDFKILTEEVIKNWFEPVDGSIEKKAQAEGEKAKSIQKLRHDFQGFIAGVIKITAEKIKAKEIGFQKVSDAISFLRVFSPAILNPQLIVGAYEYGWNNYEREKYFIFAGQGEPFQMSESIRDKGLQWTIDDKLLNFIEAPANSNFNLLLKNEKKNSFQKDIYNTILLYSRHTLKRDLSDKLMYILVSLESILLKNETEPITQNLSDRIAFLIAKTPDERLAVVQKIKTIYGIRSQFIHHGKPSVEAMDNISEFFRISWDVIAVLVRNMDRFETKLDFLSEIDKIKYS